MELVKSRRAMTKSATPVCSICIANYNGEHFLADCIDSVFRQTGVASIEVIVHDDASTDASVSLVRAHYPNVKLLTSKANVGFCISNNRMVDVALGRYVLLLNNDAALLPGALASLVEAADAASDQAIWTLPQYDWKSGALVDMGCLLDPFYNPVPNLDPKRHEVAMAIGACLFLPRQLWRHLGGFPEWMESIGEDLYLCCRARWAGHPVRLVAKSGYRHRQGASFGGNKAQQEGLKTTPRRRRLSERNKLFTLAICSPLPILVLVIPLHFLFSLVEGIAVSIKNRDAKLATDIYVYCWLSAWRSRAMLKERRDKLKADKQISWRVYQNTFTWLPRKLVLLLRYGIPTVRRK